MQSGLERGLGNQWRAVDRAWAISHSGICAFIAECVVVFTVGMILVEQRIEHVARDAEAAL